MINICWKNQNEVMHCGKREELLDLLIFLIVLQRLENYNLSRNTICENLLNV